MSHRQKSVQPLSWARHANGSWKHTFYDHLAAFALLVAVSVALAVPTTAKVENVIVSSELPIEHIVPRAFEGHDVSSRPPAWKLNSLYTHEVVLGEAQLLPLSEVPSTSLAQLRVRTPLSLLSTGESTVASEGSQKQPGTPIEASQRSVAKEYGETTQQLPLSKSQGEISQGETASASGMLQEASTPTSDTVDPPAGSPGAESSQSDSESLKSSTASNASQQSRQGYGYSQGTSVLSGVTLTVNSIMVQGGEVTQVAAYKNGAAVGVFNLTATTPAKKRLLTDISAIAENPEAMFDLTWTAISPTSGVLTLRLEASYKAAASKPTISFNFNFKHVVGRRSVSDKVTASIPKEMLLDFSNISHFKAWLAANSHPPVLKSGDGFQILTMKLIQQSKKRNEVAGEAQALRWLQQIATRSEPVLSVAGDLERNAVIEIPYFDDLTWPGLLKLGTLVRDSSKGHVPVDSVTSTIPGIKTAKFNVPPSWFSLTPEQQFNEWTSGRLLGKTGVSPSQLNVTGLFGPQYTAKSPPILFFDYEGQPLGSNKQRDSVSLFGTRTMPADHVPDYLAGQMSPAITATLVFPGGTSATHNISPVRPWHKIEKGYAGLRATLAPNDPEKQGALLSVTINGKTYPLPGDFVEKYPTLLHLLAHLATEDPSFVLDSVKLNFGASNPRSVKSIFVLETPEGVPPWCIFEYQHLLKTTIEISRDGTGRKPSMRRASHRVHFSTPVQNAIDDFSKLFAKFKFPILREDDTFTDGQGPHATRKELNIPLHPGAMSLAGPFGAIHDWLHHHIPNLQLPVNLENMQPEERNALFTKIILEAHDGKKIRLSDILKPLTHTPNWRSFNPDDYTLLYEILRMPVKNMFIEGGIEFVITTPEGGQVSHIVPVRPGESWDQAANSFFFTYPQYDKIKTKLRLFDGEGNPIVLSPESPVYVGVKEAIEQKRRGMEERVEEKKRTKQKIKAEKQAERHVRDVNVKVKLVFDVENDEAFSDSGIVISLPSDFATGLNIGGKRKVAQQLSKMYGIPKAYFTFDGYPRVVIDPAKSELPVLKVALQALCLRNDGKIGVRPAELAQVLIEKGGYGNKDYILLHAAAGEKLRVSVENARQIAPEKARMFMFAVAEPAKWMEILGPWLSRMRGFGTLADTKVQLIVHNDKAATKSDRMSKCRISTFEELLEYINDMQQLLKVCPGLLMAVTSGQPFSFDLGIRSPPPSGFRLWNRAHGDPGKNQRYLERLTVALSKVPSDSKIQWKFSKHGGGMTSDQIEKIKVLLQGNKPRDAALVREILAILGVPADDIERLTGRLNILITHEPTDQDKVLLLDIARADGPRIIRNISAHADPKTPLQIGLLDGDFSLSYSFYSPTKQISGQPCGIRSAQDFQNLTWETAVGWCNLTFDELKSHSPAFAWIEGVQMAMYPPSQPGIPVVSFQNDTPMAFTYRRPASPVSGIMPQDIYFNLVQQPGANAPGATFTQKIPEPSGGLGTDITYFGQNPQRWRARMDPGTVTMPRGTFGEFNIYPDPEQQEAGKAFVNPIIRTLEIPGFSHVPELKENLNIVFKPKTSVPMGGELVYIQAPASTGRYYFCPDLTIQQFMSLKSKEEVSRLCSNIPVELLEADFLVSAFAPGSNPNYSLPRPAVPLILVDRLNVPRYYTVAWDDDIDKFVEPLFQEGHPEDQVVFTFANANRCVATRPMLKGLKTWLELARFCSAIFGNNYPTQITGVIKVRILLPESLKTSFTKIHQGLSPESIFSYEPLALVIDNILAGQKAGITIEVTLEMNDGTRLNFNQIPEEWKNVTAPQIPGLVSIEIKDTNLGNLQDLLNQGNISPSMPFGQFVSKVTGDINSPTGLAFPSANIRIGGPPSPGVPIPHYEFELVQPEAVGADGQTANFGVRIPLAHGSIPDAFPMGEVIKTLHNPQVTVHQQPAAQHSITVMAGSNVPLTKHSQNLDMSFSDLIAWLKVHLGIKDPAGIHVTVVVDGTPYRGTFTGEQLLGHSLGSLLGMIGAADLTDSHSLVFIGQPAPGGTAQPVSEDQRVNFIVNGSIYDDKPGSPVDFAKLLQIHVPGEKQPPSDFEFTVGGPGGSSTQLVPADIMRLLQDVADMHGHPGMSLVLSFLNSLKQVSQVAPGQTIRIDTKSLEAPKFEHPEEAINKILSTPAGQLPRESYLLVFTSEGPRGRRIMVPISPQDKKKTVAKLLQHLNIVLQTILDLKIVSDVEDGALNVGVLDRTITIPIQTLSSTDRSTMDEFLSQMGQKLSSMLRSAQLTYQHLVLHTILTKADGTKIFVDTPLGPPENAERMLSSLSLWSLLPDEARHEKIRHINMRIQVNSMQNFLIQLPSGERRPISEVGDQLVRAFFRSAVSRNRTWSRVFWGKQTAEGVCGPEMEFPYFMVMSTKIADLHAPQGHDCLALIKLNFESFEVAYLYHEAPLQILTPKERKLYQAASMELEAVKRPLRELIARATGSNDVGNLMSCLITQPFVAYSLLVQISWRLVSEDVRELFFEV
ncbi:hypothetical protein cyc_07060 [Cyclospora cayetanensis]|uniref:Uncharacterized protein n=1 Tax=Cyclospora cayetanensis TaxID=88456 RepID=A0A1D3CZP4_9EIME|nr:hypothetical protein cyc_07060 [Cyclospora cayetanensis]